MAEQFNTSQQALRWETYNHEPKFENLLVEPHIGKMSEPKYSNHSSAELSSLTQMIRDRANDAKQGEGSQSTHGLLSHNYHNHICLSDWTLEHPRNSETPPFLNLNRGSNGSATPAIIVDNDSVKQHSHADRCGSGITPIQWGADLTAMTTDPFERSRCLDQNGPSRAQDATVRHITKTTNTIGGDSEKECTEKRKLPSSPLNLCVPPKPSDYLTDDSADSIKEGCLAVNDGNKKCHRTAPINQRIEEDMPTFSCSTRNARVANCEERCALDLSSSTCNPKELHFPDPWKKSHIMHSATGKPESDSFSEESDTQDGPYNSTDGVSSDSDTSDTDSRSAKHYKNTADESMEFSHQPCAFEDPQTHVPIKTKNVPNLVNFGQKETTSTRRVTDWSVSIFRRWMAKNPDRATVPNLLKMTVPQINTYLCKFLVEGRKNDGTRYPSKSLQALGQGLLRYVRNNRVYTKKECGSTSGIFRPVNQVLSMELRRTIFYEELAGRMPKMRQKKGQALPKRKGLMKQQTFIETGLTETVSEQQKWSNNILGEDKSHLIQIDSPDTAQGINRPSGDFEDLRHSSENYNNAQTAASKIDLDLLPPVEKTTLDGFSSTDMEDVVMENISTEKPFEDNFTDKINPTHPPITIDEPTNLAFVNNKSTDKNTRWAVHLFEKWRRSQSTAIPHVQHMTVDDINLHLSDFISTVVKSDGGEYIPSCLYSVACGLLRHTRIHDRFDLDFMNSKDGRFSRFQSVLTSRTKCLETDGAQDGRKHQPLTLLTQHQEKKLWGEHVFGMHTAKSLQYSVFYFNFKFFNVKSYARHRLLQREQFTIRVDEGSKVLCFESRDQRDLKEEDGCSDSATEYRNAESGPDVVGLYEIYMDAIGESGPFYKRLTGLQGPTSRFSEHGVGIRFLQVMWMDILHAVTLD